MTSEPCTLVARLGNRVDKWLLIPNFEQAFPVNDHLQTENCLFGYFSWEIVWDPEYWR